MKHKEFQCCDKYNFGKYTEKYALVRKLANNEEKLSHNQVIAIENGLGNSLAMGEISQ